MAIFFQFQDEVAAAAQYKGCAVIRTSMVASSIAVAAVLYTIIYWIQRKPSASGPRRWPLLGSTPEAAASFSYHHDWITEYAKRFKTFEVHLVMPCVRLIYTIDPANIEHFVKTNYSNYWKGTIAHEALHELLGEGIFNSEGENWQQQRKAASFEFASRILREYSTEAFRKYAVRLANMLADAALRKGVVDMNDLFMRMTFDSICEVGFGVEIGCLSPSLPAIPFNMAVDRSNAASARRFFDPFWKLKRLLSIGSEAQLKKDVALLDQFTTGLIQKRRHDMDEAEEKRMRPDLLSRFLSLSKEDPSNYTDKKLRDVILNFVIAGRDTTAATLSWFLFLVSQHPKVESKLVEEIKAAQERSKSSFPPLDHDTHDAFCCSSCVEEFAGMLTYESLGKMNYLHAAISETLRLYPAVAEDQKIAIADDVLPDGTRVRAGDGVVCIPYAMGRMEVLWGSDACQFKPERWLKDGVFVRQSPFKFTAFLAGPRMCLGKDSAFLQMKMTSVLLLNFFKFSLLPHHKVGYSMALTLVMSAGGLKMTVDPQISSERDP